MKRPLLLDLFCGAGGVAVGYHRAGFDVVGVDIERQPDFPFEFIEMDALLVEHGWMVRNFDVIHASPPCQAYTPMTNRRPSHEPRLIEAVRRMLRSTALPYVIENVPGAPLLNGAWVCGKALGLQVRRHRRSESSLVLFSTGHGPHEDSDVAVYGPPDGRKLWTRRDGTELHAWAALEEGKRALGVDWIMDWRAVREAIPPAYTEFIGAQLLEHIKRGAA